MIYTSIFIDGGFYNALQKYYNTNFDITKFIKEITNYLREKESEALELSHIYYYDCLPYIDNQSSKEDIEFYTKRLAFLNFLRSVPTLVVREGILTKHEYDYWQKEVDTLLTLDVVRECQKSLIDKVILVSGDRDFVPLVEYISNFGIQTWIVGSGNESTIGSDQLWSRADGRITLSTEMISKISKK